MYEIHSPMAVEVSMSDIVSVLSSKSVATILDDGGTQCWTLDRTRAFHCDYVVVCRNRGDHPEGDEPHGTAFLVGKVNDVVPSTATPGRWKIQISEYALVDWPEAWGGNRNPVAYYKNTDYVDGHGDPRDFRSLDYQPVHPKPTGATGLTIAAAKAGLAESLNLPESAIEIIIRA